MSEEVEVEDATVKPLPPALGTDPIPKVTKPHTAGFMGSQQISTITAKTASAPRRSTKKKQHFRTN